MTKPWIATAVAFLAGAGMAGSVAWHEHQGRISAEDRAAKQRAAMAETAPIYLLARDTCEKQMVSCAGIEKALQSGIYWPPGTTVKECAREP